MNKLTGLVLPVLQRFKNSNPLKHFLMWQESKVNTGIMLRVYSIADCLTHCRLQRQAHKTVAMNFSILFTHLYEYLYLICHLLYMQLLCHKDKPDNLTPLPLLEVLPLLKCHLFSSKKVKLIMQSAYSNVCCVYRVHVLLSS